MDDVTALTAEAFDWNKVGPELEALGQAIADTIDPSNPMQSNESTMDCLEHLWSLGYRVVPHAAARRAIEGSGVGALRAMVESAVLVPLDADEDPTEVWVVSPDALDYARAILAALAAPKPEQWAAVAAITDGSEKRLYVNGQFLDALPRPDEPRVERCAECGHETRWHMDGACACEGDGVAGLCPCPADDTLDAAWAAVEALLRPTDRLIVSTLPGGGVWARVVGVDGHRHSASADEDTPQAALSTLAQRLREAR